MAEWRRWADMAADSLDAAIALSEEASSIRSAVSRFYYAAYQAMTALLLYSGQTPPIVDGVERESWNHEVTPDMVLANLYRVVPNRHKWYQLRSNLRELYTMRVYADYVSEQPVGERERKTARRTAQYLMKVTLEAWPDAPDGEER